MKNYRKCLFIIALVLISCSKSDDDTDTICTGNCTVFKGRIQTVDNIGIPKIKVVFDYYIGTELSSYRRKIGETQSDSNGFYYLSVFLKDNELGEKSNGYFTLKIDSDKISSALSNEYLKPNVILLSDPEVTYFSILERNLTFTNDFIVPKKGNVRIKLNNFNPFIESDYFKANVKYSYSFLNENWSTIQPYEGIGGFALDNGKPTIFDAQVILNGDIRIEIHKQKNGLIENSEEIIHITNSTPLELQYDY